MGRWVASVEQGNYGHLAAKPTWLYAFGVGDLPLLRTQRAVATMVVATSSRKQKDRNRGCTRPNMPKRLRSSTPLDFREMLLGIARSIR